MNKLDKIVLKYLKTQYYVGFVNSRYLVLPKGKTDGNSSLTMEEMISRLKTIFGEDINEKAIWEWYNTRIDLDKKKFWDLMKPYTLKVNQFGWELIYKDGGTNLQKNDIINQFKSEFYGDEKLTDLLYEEWYDETVIIISEQIINENKNF